MPISFVGAGAVTSGVINPVVGLPAGIQDGDLLFLIVNAGGGSAVGAPSGWTSTFSIGSSPNYLVFNKFADGTDVNISISSGNSSITAVIIAYRGASGIHTFSTAATATSTTIASNTLTTTYDNQYVVTIYGMVMGAATWTAPGSITTRVDASGAASVTGLLVVDELLTTAGVSTPRIATSSVSKQLSVRSFSLIPSGRYWVGGTNSWDGTVGTKWSFTSGGSGGAPIPTRGDDVFFNSASTGTCTIASGNTGAKSINCTGFTGTLAGSGDINVFGSVTVAAGMTFTHTGTLTLNGTGTLISAGKTISAVTINGVGITVTLGDALNVGSTRSVNVTQGTFTTQGYAVTAAQLFSSNSNARTINLNSSTVNLSVASNALDFTTSTNLTFNAGTSQINLTVASGNVTFSGGGQTFYNVSFASGTTIKTIQGQNTFNNLTIAGPSAIGVTQVTFDSTQTINGTLATTGTAGNRRVWFQGVIYGLVQILNINSAPSLVDADFRDIYVAGTAAPISGTRIGDLRGNRGITFSTPKTVYWNFLAGGNWASTTAWAASSGGAVSDDNFPLAQDTAVIENTGLNVSATISLNTAIPHLSTIDMSSRTTAMTLNISSGNFNIYGNWKNGSGTSISGSGSLIFSGRNTQAITSAGKIFNSTQIDINSYGGTLELADALNISNQNLFIVNGTFDTKNYALTAGALSSSNSNVRAINLGSSTVTLSSGNPINYTSAHNLVFNAGTSQINLISNSGVNCEFGGMSYYNVAYTSTLLTSIALTPGSFNNLTVTPNATTGIVNVGVTNNFVVINGTLTVAGATPTRRIFVRSDTIGTSRTLTVGTLSATDCDFRDIVITGTAAGSTPTRAGNCGGNSGITFPAAKTVYWNLAGTQNWSATGWADASGGTPAINNFPLAQDIAVFDNAGTAGTVTIDQAWAIGTFDASARTSAMTFSVGTPASLVFGDWKWGTGVTSSTTTGSIICSSRVGTQTITSSAVQFNFAVQVNSISGKVQLADALLSSNSLNIQSGEFDAVLYNVTVSRVSIATSSTIFKTLRMGSGTWTLSATNPWDASGNISTVNFYKGTANIVLSNNSTTARDFSGAGLSYNKLTIGGTTSTSTTNITGDNSFTELASTKTVAHTISMSTGTQKIGKWSITGTLGNVVTFSGSGGGHIITGARVSGVDYLAMGTVSFSDSSPGEFYAGANSTGVGANVIKTAAPAPTTRYWRGGTGTWSATNTTNWSDTSGGAGGASVPTSADAVVFDAASNATAYTVTCTATQLRCGSLTFAAPASGAVTWAGSGALAVHDNFTLPATGLTRTYSGTITLSGSTTGRTFTTNGVVLASNIFVNGVGCEWSLGSAVSLSSNYLILVSGGFDLNGYNFTAAYVSLYISTFNSFKLRFGNSTLTLGGGIPLDFFATNQSVANLDFNAGTSQINCTGSIVSALTFKGNNQTFYNVAFTNTSGSVTINGANTFNNLSFAGRTTGITTIVFTADQTINSTLIISAGVNATARNFLRSDTIGTTRTLTCAAFTGTDVDFRDIAITGAAAPVSGTRLADCKGNSGITFNTPKIVYWNLAGSNDWSAIAWAPTPSGTPNINNFPLAQDTAIFTSTVPAPNTTTTISSSYNIGTIDMSARTTNTMTLRFNSSCSFYGDYINGSGITISDPGAQATFTGRNVQYITSAGKSFISNTIFGSPNGSVVLLDAFLCSELIRVDTGTFNANGYNVTAGGLNSITTNIRTIAVGGGTWTLSRSNAQIPWDASTSTNLTVTGTGTINLTSAGAKTFAGGGVSYAGITLNQGGAGTLTITGNNTFADISNTYRGTNATTIALGTTTQRVGTFSASGAPGAILTITGTSATSPATLIYTGSGEATPTKPNYLTIIGVRAYNLADTWYAGANSTNRGSLGWIFAASSAAVVAASTFFLLF